MLVAAGFVPSVQVDFVDKFSREGGEKATNQQNETQDERVCVWRKIPTKASHDAQSLTD